MLYWTIAPAEWLTEDEEQPPSLVEMAVGRVRLVLERNTDGTERVHRVLSTDPADYLRPELQPGAEWRRGAGG